MSQLALPWRRQTDEEFVEMTRTMIRRWDRFRIVMILVALAIIVGSLVLAERTAALLMKFQPGAGQAVVAGLAMGGALGLTFGFLIYAGIEMLVKSFLGNLRAERLMVRYHDALLAVAGGAPIEENLSCLGEDRECPP